MSKSSLLPFVSFLWGMSVGAVCFIVLSSYAATPLGITRDPIEARGGQTKAIGNPLEAPRYSPEAVETVMGLVGILNDKQRICDVMMTHIKVLERRMRNHRVPSPGKLQPTTTTQVRFTPLTNRELALAIRDLGKRVRRLETAWH